MNLLEKKEGEIWEKEEKTGCCLVHEKQETITRGKTDVSSIFFSTGEDKQKKDIYIVFFFFQ